MSNIDFENIIKEKFSGAESQVPVGAWSAVSSSIGGASASTGVFSTLIGKIAAAVVIGGVVVTAFTLLVLDQKDSNPTSTLTEEVSTPDLKPKVEKESSQTKIVESIIPEQNSESISTADEKKLNSVSSKQSNPLNESEITSIDNLKNQIEISNVEHTELSDNNQVEIKAAATSVVDSESTPEDSEPIIELFPTRVISSKTESSANSVVYSSNNSNEALSFKWYINDELVSESASFNHEYLEDGEYNVMSRIYKDGALKKTIFYTEQVVLDPVLFVPNTFTPQSSGGFNDYFDIDQELSQNIYWYEINIFSPEGSLVFKSNNHARQWDGLDLNGNLAPRGAYVYVVNYKSKSSETLSKKGKVILQR